jgi:hypothetical protein
MRTIAILILILITSTLNAQRRYSNVGKIREKPVILIQCPLRDEKMVGAKELNQKAKLERNSLVLM